MPKTPRTERPSPPVDVALVPLVLAGAAIFWLPAATTGASASRAIAALTLGALLALVFARDPFAAHPRVRGGAAVLAGLVVWYLASRSWAIAPAGSMLEAARIAAFGLGIYGAHVALVRTTSRVLALAALGVAAMYVAGPELWNVLRHGAPTVRDQGKLGYWNATAIISLTLVPLSALLIRSRRFGLALLAGPLLAAAVAATAVTASRGALAATILGLGVLVLLDPNRRLATAIAVFVGFVVGAGVALLSNESIPGWVSLLVVVVLAVNGAIGFRRVGLAPIPLDDGMRPRRLTPLRIAGGVLCAAAAVVVIALAVHASGNQPAAAGVPAVNQQQDLSRLTSTDDSRRVEWWKQAVRDWRDAPIVGQGGDAFETLGAVRADAQAEHAHSSALQLLVEVGVVGLLLALVVAGLFTRAVLGASRTPERAVAAAIVAMIVLQTLIDWTWSLPQVMVLLVVAIAVALPRPQPAHGEVPLAPLPTVFATLAAFGLLTLIAVAPFGSDLLTDQSARDFDAGHLAKAADHARQARALSPTFDALQLEVAALEQAGKRDRARAVLRSTESVWLHRPDGLRFAMQRLAGDSKFGPIIEREAARQARIAEETQPKP